MSDQSSGSKARPLPPSTIHDVITGGVEGGLSGLAMEQLAGKDWVNPFREGFAGRFAKNAAIGAGATGLIGALVSLAGKKAKQRRQPDELEAVNEVVTEFRKLYEIHEDEQTGETKLIKLPGSSKAKAAFKGATIGTAAGAVAGAAGAVALPRLAEIAGASERVIKAVKGRTPILVGASLIGKIGGTVGAIEAVSKLNERQRRSAAIAKAIRDARAGRPVDLERKETVIEFDDYVSPQLRSGVRYDRYHKQIQAREIDRKISNVTKAAGLGAIAGVALPLPHSPRHRAIFGAIGGAGLATGLILGADKDQYGEQSEGSKLLQKRTIQGTAAAALVTAAIMRKRKLGEAFTKVKGVVGRVTASPVTAK